MKKETTTTTKETTEKAVFLVNYSEKAIAVFGNTKKYKEQLKELKGRFNPYLKNEGVKTPGWIFSKKFQAEVTEFVNSL